MLCHVSSGASSILFAEAQRKRKRRRRVLRLSVSAAVLFAEAWRHCALRTERRGDACTWRASPSGSIHALSFGAFCFDGGAQAKLSVFGAREVRWPWPLREEEVEQEQRRVEWLVRVERCAGDLCVGVQCADERGDFDEAADFCFCDDARRGFHGWGYHCDGFLKHRASFTRFGRKFGRRDTVGVAMALHADADALELSFALNGKRCRFANSNADEGAIKLPRRASKWRLAVSVGLNSVAQVAIVGFANS